MTPAELDASWACEECGERCAPEPDLPEGEPFLCFDCRQAREDVMCERCAGSGEGPADGTTCGLCGGAGVPRKPKHDPDPDFDRCEDMEGRWCR